MVFILVFPIFLTLFSCRSLSAGETQNLTLHATVEHICVAKSLFRTDIGTWCESASSRIRAMELAVESCEKYAGANGGTCFVSYCTSGRDNGSSDLNGPAVCHYLDVQTHVSGFSDGPTRIEARKNALEYCIKGMGQVGINCIVDYCVARGDVSPFDD